MCEQASPSRPVKAFRQAFEQDQDVRLIVKLRGGDLEHEIRKQLEIIANSDSRITILDKTISRQEIEQLVLRCDAFISLHRSEGFGFGPAEALAAGKPVVTTRYGGVADFIHPETAYPVGFNLVPVGLGEYHQAEGQMWAEPIIEDAVEALMKIKADTSAASAIGNAGREWMIKNHGIEAVGQLIERIIS